MAKIHQKITHDRITVIVDFDDKTWLKLIINRSGISIKRTCSKEIGAKYSQAFDKVYKVWEKTENEYSDLVEKTINIWNSILPNQS